MPTSLADYGASILGVGLMAWVLRDVLCQLIRAVTGVKGEATRPGDARGEQPANQLLQQVITNNTHALSSLDAAIRQQSQILQNNTNATNDLRVEVARIKETHQ